MDIRQLIKEKRLFFDGGMGTNLQSLGLGSTPPEIWNIERPETIIQLHRAYLDSGCDIIKTNTFGINRDKYDNFDVLIRAAIDCAKKAINGEENKFIAFDLGPCGRLLSPMGDLPFEDAVELFSANIKIAKECGVDLILIETMNDSYETKAAVLAVKETCDLPIFVTNAYSEDGNLMTGASPESMVALLEGLGVDALGINCSFGPDKMSDIVKRLSDASSLPVIVNPNAGLPKIHDEKTVFDIGPEEFSDHIVNLYRCGASIFGGCCGTTPKHIKAIVEKLSHLPYILPSQKDFTRVCSYGTAVDIGKKPILIGERINPTGKPKLKEALREKNMTYILKEGLGQVEKGVDILDVNVGLPEIDEAEMMKKAVISIQSVTNIPLQIDSSNPKVLETAMRIYNGKPLINSVNGEEKSMHSVFPLVKKYGGSVIALTMDKDGIPESAQERLQIAQKIADCAKTYGIEKKDIIVDPLCLSVSSNVQSANITLESVRLLSESGFKTSLGVSNVSFGLPQREKINSSFFTLALENGLDCAIINPFSSSIMDAYHTFILLKGLDEGCKNYIEYTSKTESPLPIAASSENTATLEKAVISGLKEEGLKIVNELLKTESPLDIINNRIIPALDKVGVDFEKGHLFLPQLLMSAEASSAALERLKAEMPAVKGKDEKPLILATVQGDIHDIGKNIVKLIAESYAFKVYDLGRDVDPDTVLGAVKKTGCKLVGLSALMTTTVPSMAKTIEVLKEYDKTITVIVGGAVLNQEYADMISADFYAKTAIDTVRFAEEFY